VNASTAPDVVTIRAATGGDVGFLELMLVEAVHWEVGKPRSSPAETLALPEHRRYLAGWPRETDAGVVATDERGQLVGAAWFRFFPAEDPGYGFVAEDVPEVAIGVVPEYRGQGTGGSLLTELEKEARRRRLRGLSLSVAHANRAAELYRRHGYREVARLGDTVTMALSLR
jgi:ribosomal protein S18 acetylase RimI-like enzyme